MVKIIFWIIVLVGCITTVMLYLIMFFRKAFAFKEALIYNFAFLGLFISQTFIDLHFCGYTKSSIVVNYSEQIFLILSSLYLPLFSNTLVKKSRIKIPSPVFKVLASINTILLFSSMIFINTFLLKTGTLFFIFAAHYSTILLTFSIISETSVGYGSVIQPKKIKAYCALFLMFSPFITFGDLFRVNIFNIPKGIYYLPALFFIKNIFSFSGIFKYLAIESYNKLDTINHTTIIKDTNFTSNEKDIIKLLLQGKSNSEISEILFKSINTIKDTVKKIYKKSGTNSKTELLFFIKRYKTTQLGKF